MWYRRPSVLICNISKFLVATYAFVYAFCQLLYGLPEGRKACSTNRPKSRCVELSISEARTISAGGRFTKAEETNSDAGC